MLHLGDRALISGNDIRDGQDMGITANGGEAMISNNVVRHQGAGGIASSGGGTLISNNILSRNSWVNFQDHVSLADIIVGSLPISSDRPLVTGNQCDGEDKPLARYGIVLTILQSRLWQTISAGPHGGERRSRYSLL